MVFKCQMLFILLVSLFLSSKDLFSQIYYPDSCLRLEFYYQNRLGNLDTIKQIRLKKESRNFESIYWNESLLNLVILFRNNCRQNITVPSEIKFGADFWIEGLRFDGNRIDTLRNILAVDYEKGKIGTSNQFVTANSTKMLNYPFPLGLKITSKGFYKFRLVFINSHNYIPIDKWKTYYSNWLYLKLL